MNQKENRLLLLTGIICAVGCMVIAVFNAAQGAFLHADVVPESAYYEAPSVSSATDGETGAADAGQHETININTATAEELAAFLPGIGEKKAEKIVAYRETAGGFDSVDELLNVSGIGEKTLETLRPYCRVSDDETP